MPVVGLHHVGISVPDLDEAIAFYTEAFGLRLVQRARWSESEVADAVVDMEGSAARLAVLWAGNAAIELFEYSSPTPSPQAPDRPVADHGINHLCFQVTDIHGEYERLRRLGMRFHAAPVEVEDGWATYGRDPWGNVIELSEMPDDLPHPRVDVPWTFTIVPDTSF